MALGTPLTRVSPGMYRNQTGGLVRSSSKPKVQPLAPKPTGFTPATAQTYKNVDAKGTVLSGTPTSQEIDAYNAYMGARGKSKDWRNLKENYLNIRRARVAGANTPAPEVAPTPEATPTPTPEGGGINYFPSWQQFFSPDNFQMTYDLGTKNIDRELAKAGMFQSGANIEAKNDLMRKTFVDERKAAMELSQINADRAERMAQAEAERRRLQENAYTDNLLKALQLSTSLYSLKDGQNAAGDFSSLQKQIGDIMSGFAQQGQRRATGGGGASAGPFIPPPPSGPNFAQSDLLSTLGNIGTNAGITNTIGTGLNYLNNLI